MMSAMYTTGAGSGIPFLWGLHGLSMIIFGVGLLFVVFWAVKRLHERQLRNWGIGLLLGGGAACLLTLVFLGSRWHGARGPAMACDGMKMDRMMEGAMDDDEDGDDDASAASRRMGMMNGARMGMTGSGGAMGMPMRDMALMLEGKTGDAFDAAFLQMMIPHHQSAVDMAKLATNAKHGEVRELARDILGNQQHEIDAMRQWQRDWGYAQ